MKDPLFSIIMPVYNRESFLPRSIESVLQQTYSDYELICIDDGSTDGSSKIIQGYSKKDPRIKYVHQTNKGRCLARNIGLKHARGHWACFLDSDDFYFPNHLSAIKDLIEKHPQLNDFATEQTIEGKNKTYINRSVSKNNYVISFKDNIYSNPISLNQLSYNRKAIAASFPEENIPISEDWLFMRQLTLKTDILKSNIPTTGVKEHSGRTLRNHTTSDIAKWNSYTSEYFIRFNELSNALKNKIRSSTSLLCSNILLSTRNKEEAISYLSKALAYRDTYLNPLFYKALIKLLF